jgi:hypothetical protein
MPSMNALVTLSALSGHSVIAAGFEWARRLRSERPLRRKICAFGRKRSTHESPRSEKEVFGALHGRSLALISESKKFGAYERLLPFGETAHTHEYR